MNTSKRAFDIEGHRGARGVYPENSIPGFIYALELGVTTIEMDVVVSADRKLVVSHDPWMSSAICLHPDGTPVTKDEEAGLNLYRIDYDEIKRYDCGSRGNERFPLQQKMPVCKPLFSEVIDTIEKIIRQKNFPRSIITSRPSVCHQVITFFIPSPLSLPQCCWRKSENTGLKNA